MTKKITDGGIKTTNGDVTLTTSEIISLATETNILMQRTLNETIARNVDGKFNSELNFPMFNSVAIEVNEIKYIIDGTYFLKYSFKDHCIKAIVGKAYINREEEPGNPILLISASASVTPDDSPCYIGNALQAKLTEKLTENYYIDPKKKKDKDK